MPLLIMFLITYFHPVAEPHDVTVRPADDWNRAFQTRRGWTGGDCAGTVPLPGDRVLWLFGDSWIGPVEGGRHADGSRLVNNAIAVHSIRSDGMPPKRDDIEFVWGGVSRDGTPSAWVVPYDTARGEGGSEKNLRYWPTGGGIVVAKPGGGQRLYVFLMRVRDKNESDGVWNFEGCGSAIVSVENPKDGPSKWRLTQTTLTRLPHKLPVGARRIAWGLAALPDDTVNSSKSEILIYGIDTIDGLNKKLLLAKAPGDLAEDFQEWRFWDGKNWARDEGDAAPIAEKVMDELTVHRLGDRRDSPLTMVYSKPILDDHIVLRTAPKPWGPWSAPRQIYRCPEPSTDKRLMAYSAKAHPELSRDGSLLITYCVNSTDFFHMAGNTTIYRPRFIEVPRSSLEGPPER